MAESALAKKLAKNGWTVRHEREPIARQAQAGKNAATQVIVEEGLYTATKRHDNGNTLVQFDAATPEELERLIEGWEHEQAVAVAVPDLSDKGYKESAENSVKATALMSVSASARDIAANPDAHDAAVEQREGAVSQAEIAGKAAEAVGAAVEAVKKEVEKAGGTEAASKDAAEVARSAVEKAVATQPHA